MESKEEMMKFVYTYAGKGITCRQRRHQGDQNIFSISASIKL